MSRRSTRIAIALASVLTILSAGAQAQEQQARQPADPLVFGTGATYEVKFDDDPLAALGNGVLIPRLTVKGSFPHAQLMRPRTHFVVEMLKSSEGI
jgi:hypothetical protein